MKYFLDTEFIEGFKKPIKWLPTIGNFNKPYHSIQLISIGIVAEDGREYYAISNEFNPEDANDWVKENVLNKLPEKNFNGHNAQTAKLWKSNKQIAEEVRKFCGNTVHFHGNKDIPHDYYSPGSPSDKCYGKVINDNNPEFYAYYADYDWVVFCSLFGTMMDLPKGFSRYCHDLKQTLDETLENNEFWLIRPHVGSPEHGPLANQTLENKLVIIKQQDGYPKQTNEHNALADAKWNFELYKFLSKL